MLNYDLFLPCQMTSVIITDYKKKIAKKVTDACSYFRGIQHQKVGVNLVNLFAKTCKFLTQNYFVIPDRQNSF